MKFIEGHLFHIYNRGINRQFIFFNHKNYIFFLRKIRKYIFPYSEILAYCLMPNHFHFLIYANSLTISTDKKGRNLLSDGFRHLLSSYTKAINVQENRTGSLFTQNTHCKNVDKGRLQAFTCFRYIHQNPLRAGLSNKLEDWMYSSFRDYCGLRKGTLCNKDLAFELLNFDRENFYSLSYDIIQDYKIRDLF